MNLYKINNEINELVENSVTEIVDESTGEITYVENPQALAKLDELKLTKEEVISNVCYKYKEIDAFEERVAKEIKRLQSLKKVIENKKEGIKTYLSRNIFEDQKLQTEFFNISWRKSESLEIDDFYFDLEAFYKENPSLVKIIKEPKKTEIKKLVKEGARFEGVSLKTKKTIQIK
jgi:hypothetical protein